MRPSIGILYGPHKHKTGSHPWDEDMFMRPNLIQASLKQEGFNWEVGYALDPPTRRDEHPRVVIAQHPVYNNQGKLIAADFKLGHINEWAGVIDHWIDNFEEEMIQPDGTPKRVAYGLGIEPGRTWNHRRIQAYGNDKSLVDAILSRLSVGPKTYQVGEYERLVDEYGSDCAIIYKPLGGSIGRGIEIFTGAKQLQTAFQQEKRLAPNGLIQRYRNIFQPIKGLIPATPQDETLLKTFNTTSDRAREVRVHVITWTDRQGIMHTKAAPTLKYNYPDLPIMKKPEGYIGLDPKCMPESSPMYQAAVSVAQAICAQAGEPDKPIPQYYGVADFLVEGDINDPNAFVIGDKNCRGPHLPVCAYTARQIFSQALAESGRVALATAM